MKLYKIILDSNIENLSVLDFWISTWGGPGGAPKDWAPQISYFIEYDEWVVQLWCNWTLDDTYIRIFVIGPHMGA